MELSVRRLFLPGGTQSGGPQLFESTRLCKSDICAKENHQCISTPAVFSWARVDYASRAAKNSPLGCFCAVFGDSAAAVRIHPWICFEKFRTKEKLQHLYDAGVFGGAKQPKSEPLPSGASLAAISSKVMVFVPSL